MHRLLRPILLTAALAAAPAPLPAGAAAPRWAAARDMGESVVQLPDNKARHWPTVMQP